MRQLGLALGIVGLLSIQACAEGAGGSGGDAFERDAVADVTSARPDGADAASDTQRAPDADATSPATIGWAVLQHPVTFTGAVDEVMSTYGRVFVEGRTEVAGPGEGIEAQAGVGAPDAPPAEWTWIGGAFNVDAGANDEYVAALTLPDAGAWRFAWRFRVDGGPWVLADTRGTEGGFDVGAAGALTVAPSIPAEVDWCALQHPPAFGAAPGAPVGPIFGRVYEAGVTEGGDDSALIVAELGHGDPAQVPADWAWRPATFHAAAGNDDEYRATFAASVEDGSDWAYAYRFRLEGGGSWTYCDLGGSGDGFDVADAGVLSVRRPDDPTPDWASLRPATVSWPHNQSAPPIEVVVYEAGVTSGAGAGPDVVVEVAHGPVGSDPREGGGWTVVEAAYDRDEHGLGTLDNDVYAAALERASEGPFAYVARVSVDGGDTFAWVDTGGLGDGFSLAALGRGEVLPAATPRVDWCRLREPAVVSVALGETAVYVAEVFEEGITPGGDPSEIEAEVGRGDRGAHPDGPSWRWEPAEPAGEIGDNDLYEGALTAPDDEGTWDVAFRARLVGESAWLPCDRDGSDSGYDPARAGRLEVAVAPPATVDFGVVAPAELVVDGCAAPQTFTIDVYEPGVTDAPGEGPGLVVEGGYGPAGGDPSADPEPWTFSGASYIDDVAGAGVGGANDRYRWAVPRLPAGQLAVVGRASLDGGATWTYLDASEAAGFDADAASSFTVTSVGAVCYARLMGEAAPRVAAAGGDGAFTAAVELWSGGVTDGPGPGVGFEVEIGHAVEASSPDVVAADWAWVAASYARDGDGAYALAHDVYEAEIPGGDDATERFIAARARPTGGGWVYIDADPAPGASPVGLHAIRYEDPFIPDFCRLQWPLEAVAVAAGEDTEPLFGQVWEPGVTGAAGHPLPAVEAQVGYGPRGSDPSADASGWTFVDAPWSAHSDNGFGALVHDEHRGVLSPPEAGAYDIAWRFRLARTGAGWRYCDPTGGEAYDPSEAVPLDVSD